MPAPKNNQYAKKPDGEALSSRVWINLKPAEKAKLVRAAKGEKLTEWGRRKLLEAADES